MSNLSLFEEIDAYIDGLFAPPDPVLEAAIADSRAAGMPQIQVSPGQGKLLYLLAKLRGARRILEIGTLAGYSAIWLARALPKDGKLTSLEFSPKHAEVARKNLARAGLEGKVEIIVGPALETLPELRARGEAPFDLVFLDADKESYAAYLDWSLKLSQPGTLILADNVIRGGAVLHPEKADVMAKGSAAFNAKLAADPHLEAIILQQVGIKGHDGLGHGPRQGQGPMIANPKPAAAQSDRIVSRESLPQEAPDVALRPQTLSDFIGQESLCANLKIFVAAAKQRKQPLDHVLLFGPPGLGKTTLAQIIAKELGVGFRATSGPVIARAGDLAALLTNLQPHDVLFIDEIHRLAPPVEEILYPAMEDFQLDLIIGEGPAARSVRIDLPPFTLIGATTRSGLITRPLRERFGIPLRLQFYEPGELQIILSRAASKLDMPLTKDGAFEIAKRARGTPRVAGRLLRRVRDFAAVAGHKSIDAKAADAALARLEVDSLGFDAMDRRYLKMIADHYGGGPVGVETLAAALAEQRDVLEEVIEPYLIQQGLLQRTPRGRMLAEAGYRHLGLTAPAGRQADLLAGSSAGDEEDEAR